MNQIELWKASGLEERFETGCGVPTVDDVLVQKVTNSKTKCLVVKEKYLQGKISIECATRVIDKYLKYDNLVWNFITTHLKSVEAKNEFVVLIHCLGYSGRK